MFSMHRHRTQIGSLLGSLVDDPVSDWVEIWRESQERMHVSFLQLCSRFIEDVYPVVWFIVLFVHCFEKMSMPLLDFLISKSFSPP